MFDVLDKINLDTRQRELARRRDKKFACALQQNYVKCMNLAKEASEMPIRCEPNWLGKEMANALRDHINQHEPLLEARVGGTRLAYPFIYVTLRQPETIDNSKDDVDRTSM